MRLSADGEVVRPCAGVGFVTEIEERAAILDAARALAISGGFRAVNLRAVAKRAGLTLGPVCQHFRSKTDVLVSVLVREFERVDDERDWSACAASPVERLESLSARLHDEWQQNARLTEATVRGFVVAHNDEALTAQHAVDVVESMLARAIAGTMPGAYERQVAGLITDIWLANLMDFVGGRTVAAEARDCINRAVRRLLGV